MGINALFRPASALALFQFPAPADPAARQLVENLIIVYGSRDIVMGSAIWATAFFGSRKALGSILLVSCFAAVVDGFVSLRQIGRGQWNHWGLVPLGAGVGALLMGVAD